MMGWAEHDERGDHVGLLKGICVYCVVLVGCCAALTACSMRHAAHLSAPRPVAELQHLQRVCNVHASSARVAGTAWRAAPHGE